MVADMGAVWLGARHVLVALLAAAHKRQRPRDRKAANQRYELPPSHPALSMAGPLPADADLL